MHGRLWGDAAGKHPFARNSLLGQAIWAEEDVDVDILEGNVVTGVFHTLQLSVPPGLHGAITWRKKRARARASFLPWHQGGIGIVVLSSQQQAVVAALDIAGRTDLGKLHQAASEGKTCAVLVTAGEPELKPWVPLCGLREAIEDAQHARRFSAKEFTNVIEELRVLLRSDALFPILGTPREELRSLTLNVCQAL